MPHSVAIVFSLVAKNWVLYAVYRSIFRVNFRFDGGRT